MKNNLNEERCQQLEELEKKIGYRFGNKSYLNQSLTHKSFVYERSVVENNKKRNCPKGEKGQSAGDNESLEFLGDVVLSLAVSEYLYERFPGYPEGQLSKFRSFVVSKPVLARRARALSLGDYLLLGRGEERTGGRKRSSNLANAFEALIAAIYLDTKESLEQSREGGVIKRWLIRRSENIKQGLEPCRRFVLSQLKEEIERVRRNEHGRDYKSLLQEHTQRMFHCVPHYRIVTVRGPEHNKTFAVEVKWRGRIWGRGTGLSKKKAEQDAAKQAWGRLHR